MTGANASAVSPASLAWAMGVPISYRELETLTTRPGCGTARLVASIRLGKGKGCCTWPTQVHSSFVRESSAPNTL